MLVLKGRLITECWLLKVGASLNAVSGRRITQCWFLRVGGSLNAGS